MFSMGISGALWKDILRIAIGWNKSDRPIANHGYSYGNLSNPMWKMIKPPEAFNCHGKFMGIVFFFYFVLQNLMKQIPVAFMFLFHGLS
jgi:hypothetical protein